jgi:hypothetical protein
VALSSRIESEGERVTAAAFSTYFTEDVATTEAGNCAMLNPISNKQ